MSKAFKKLQRIDKNIKYIVFGYIRECEQQLNLSSNVPPMISFMCLLYHFHGEYFQNTGNDINMSTDRAIITKIENPKHGIWSNVSYTKQWIDSDTNLLVKWTLKVHDRGHVYFCVVSSDKRLNKICATNKDQPNYSFGVPRSIEACDPNCKKSLSDNIPWFDAMELITLILDTKNRCISVQKNDEKAHCIIKNIVKRKGVRYKIAVSIASPNCSVSLINFERTNVRSNIF
eukprot:125643_1